MKILTRHLGKTVIHTSLSVLAVLIALFALINLIAETGDVGKGNYTLLSACTYVLLTLPSQFYSFAPIALLLGTLLGLGALAKYNELNVVRINGVSLGQLAWALFKATWILIAVVVLIGEGLAPRAARLAENHKTLLTTGGQTFMTKQGTLWIRDGQDFIYIHSILTPTHLKNVTRYTFNSQQHLERVAFAEEVKYENQQWKATHIAYSTFNLPNIQSAQLKEAIWPLSFNPKLLKISVINPENMSLHQLRETITYREKNHLSSQNYRLAFWQRLLQPLAIWIMMALAIPFTFTQPRNAATSVRTIMGTLVGFSFYLLNQFFSPVAIVYQWPPILAALLPLFIFMTITLFLYRSA